MFALLDHSESELQQSYLSGPAPLGPGAAPLERLLAYGAARLKMNAAHLDILLEADLPGTEFWSHPVSQASSMHVQILLRQLGFPDPVEVTAIALLTPLGATAVKHLTEVVGLDLETIITQWQTMVTSMVGGLPVR